MYSCEIAFSPPTVLDEVKVTGCRIHSVVNGADGDAQKQFASATSGGFGKKDLSLDVFVMGAVGRKHL